MKRIPAPPAPKRPFTHREALKVASTAAAALGTVGLGLFLYDRVPPASKPLPPLKDHKIARPAGAAQMAIVHGSDAADNTRRAIEALGGMGAFVRPGDRVVVKPNIGWNRLPEQAANSNPDVVAQVVRMVLAAGASKVWVTDNPVNNAERCFERSGILKATGAAGGTAVLPNSGSFREVLVEGKVLHVANVLWPVVEADRVINVPIVKHHGMSAATLSMKNWYGVLGGHRVRLHQDIHRSIVDLAAMVKPTLTVLDCTRLLMANGPTGGSLDDVKRFDAVAAGIDEVALDAFGASLLGLKPEAVGFIGEAERSGLGRSDYKSLKLVEVGGSG